MFFCCYYRGKAWPEQLVGSQGGGRCRGGGEAERSRHAAGAGQGCPGSRGLPAATSRSPGGALGQLSTTQVPLPCFLDQLGWSGHQSSHKVLPCPLVPCPCAGRSGASGTSLGSELPSEGFVVKVQMMFFKCTQILFQSRYWVKLPGG